MRCNHAIATTGQDNPNWAHAVAGLLTVPQPALSLTSRSSMEHRPMYDVRPEQYATVIRELIRHENDVTNHRIMWLLVM